MKAVILAAGKGTRMGELTNTHPKPLLKIRGKTLLEYKMDILPDTCNEIIIIIGHLGEKIKEYFGQEYNRKKVTYIHADPMGTGFALWQAKEYLTEQFIVMCGDDLYTRKDVTECLKYDFSALVSIAQDIQSGGKVILENNIIKDIEEGTHKKGNVIATGLYVLNPEIFKFELKKIDGRDEYGLPQTLMQIKEKGIHAVFATAWHQVTSPADLEVAEDKLNFFK